MRAREIYAAALALLFETDSSAGDYAEHAPAILSAILPETFTVNEQLRAWKGLEPLEACPVVGTLDDETPYEDELCRAALPYGLAANLLLGDEEEGRAGDYFGKYADAVNAAMRITPEAVRDVY